MWAVLLAGLLAAFRRRLRLPPKLWQALHICLGLLTVGGSVVHALLIEGTMGPISKALLCGLVLIATAIAAIRLKFWDIGRRRA